MSAQTAPRRPFGFRLLWLETVLIALRGWGRVWVVLDQMERYRALDKAPPLALIIGVNLAWGIVFATLAIGLWRRHVFALRSLWACLLAYSAFELGWFRIFAHASYDRARFSFLVFFTLCVMAVNTWLILRPRFRTAFILDAVTTDTMGEIEHDGTIQDSTERGSETFSD